MGSLTLPLATCNMKAMRARQHNAVHRDIKFMRFLQTITKQSEISKFFQCTLAFSLSISLSHPLCVTSPLQFSLQLDCSWQWNFSPLPLLLCLLLPMLSWRAKRNGCSFYVIIDECNIEKAALQRTHTTTNVLEGMANVLIFSEFINLSAWIALDVSEHALACHVFPVRFGRENIFGGVCAPKLFASSGDVFDLKGAERVCELEFEKSSAADCHLSRVRSTLSQVFLV